MEEIKEEKIILNGKELTQAEFENEKKTLTEKKIQLVEVSKNNFATRMLD